MQIVLMQNEKKITLQALRGYKWAVSPMLPTACRYVPTCSEYAIEAVERYGALRGSWMALWRVLRCHPLAGSGHDPVPVNEQDSIRHCGVCAPNVTR
jgi:putative membrane protein insertion efficiency factor